MHPSWDSFETFYAELGDRPDGLTLDRIDGTRGYEPGNCRWATRQEQSENVVPRDGATPLCMECGCAFEAKRAWQMFCQPAHKAAFHNRSSKRGRVIMPMLLTSTAQRRAKAGTAEYDQCAQARAWVYELCARWEREDRLAGRPPMGLVTQVKMDMGWSPVDLEVED